MNLIKSINLFHCLNELGDHSLVEEIQQYLKSRRIKEAKLSSSQWSAVAFVLLTSEEELNEFRLDKFVKKKNEPENMKVLQKLLPVIKESRSVQLSYCSITDEGCAVLASALRSYPSHLRELDLSWNKIGKSVNLLSGVLQNPHCKLEKLWLRDCDITDEGCSALASALRSNPSQLRQLCLSLNEIGDLGVKRLCAGLEDPHCKLEILWLNDCGFTDEGCAALASALRSNPSHLRELSLTGNKLGKSVNLLSDFQNILEHKKMPNMYIIKIICAVLTLIRSSGESNTFHSYCSQTQNRESLPASEDCVIVLYRFSYCSITDEGCTALASALRSNPSHLRELDLYGNKLRDSGVKRLCAGLKDPHCKLEILW
uniref:NACHT LRR and PYD domain-containing protein n=1 Tax=Cyprinus carpio TaxID=7962 RepID=A0A8C2EAD2_CYPCA